MPWGGAAGSQTFSRTDGTRTGATTWQQADAAGVDIISPDHDTHDQDIGDGISACFKKDGGNTATANLPMGGFRLTNVGAAAAQTDLARFSDVVGQKGVYSSVVGGTANAITITTGYSLTAYVAGQRFTFIPTSTNSGATTLNVDGNGAKNVYTAAGAALNSGEIAANVMCTVVYDGTQFILHSATATPVALAVGGVIAWPLDEVPSGWLEADGSAVSRTTYSALFVKYSTKYGVGDGSTTFNLPNYKDYFLRGFDASGTDASSRTDRGDGTTGASVGTKQDDAFESHLHAQAAQQPTFTFNTNETSDTGGGFSAITSIQASGLTNTLTPTADASPGDTATTGGTETRPKNITVKWIILALPAATYALGTGYTASPRVCHTGGIPAQVSTDGTDTTPVTTETYIAEVLVPANCTGTGVAIFNGSAVAGNVAVAIANSSGGVLASSAATAASGTDAYQRVAFSSTVTLYGPATYYVLLQCNNTSNRFNSHTFGNFGASKKTGETFGTFTTITPPSTFTTALGPIASLY